MGKMEINEAPRMCPMCGREMVVLREKVEGPKGRMCTARVCPDCLHKNRDYLQSRVYALKDEIEKLRTQVEVLSLSGHTWDALHPKVNSFLSEFCRVIGCEYCDPKDPIGDDYCFYWQSFFGDLSPDQIIYCKMLSLPKEEDEEDESTRPFDDLKGCLAEYHEEGDDSVELVREVRERGKGDE